ncbi:MAG: 5-methylcytosine-specific restriction system specificity protein McrC [Methanobacterium sp.]|jgi:5-methylcytosine-specific restriction enzyme subunit McrC|nr:MAG: 5-methylcytosine-specific restriction system specificity protein McrC [Methanobacterium sp.]
MISESESDKTRGTEYQIAEDMVSSKNEIPIKNIYYMLSYAYTNLKIDDNVKKESESFENIYELLSRVLISGVNNLIKRGFYKEYITKDEDTSNIRGKINITESIKRQTRIYKRLNCLYDEFSEDVLFNSIIKTTINNLIRIKDLNKKLKSELNKLTLFFDSVLSIDLSKRVFSLILWNRNNQHYKLIINICELIFKLELPDEAKDGKIHFKDFIKRYEKEMAILFEKFVFNYYKKEFKDLKVYNPEIKWSLDKEYENNFKNTFLPNMYTDIVLETKDLKPNNPKQLIIDTKFYSNILSENSSLNSGNLYQIYSYVNNSPFEGEIRGMLLYAALGEEINLDYKIGERIIYIKTLNLNQDWREIDKRLKEIANLIAF